MQQTNKIFIVGNSRSGTTMLGRMFAQHSQVHTFQELHFFEQMVDASSVKTPSDWTEQQLLPMLERLLTSSRDSLFSPVKSGTYANDARSILAQSTNRDPVSVYAAFLQFETHRAGRVVPCEQTPRYLYQAEEILDAFPDAHMICLIRDPRSVLLSQKNKWRRRKLGASNMPWLWAARSWVNYHPYTTSLMWASASRRADGLQSHPRFHVVQYEQLLKEPTEALQHLSHVTGLTFEASMIEIPQVGSSSGQDKPDQLGVDVSRINAWQQGGLSAGEIRLCERTARAEMDRWGYELSGTTSSPLSQAGLMLGFVFKSAAALALNFRRFKNIGETIKRRFS